MAKHFANNMRDLFKYLPLYLQDASPQLVRTTMTNLRQMPRAQQHASGIIKLAARHRNIHKIESLLSSATKAATTLLFCLLHLLLLLNCSGSISALDESPFAPRITIQPNDLIAIEGESAELNCDAEAKPAPTIEWYHNGHLIRDSTRSRSTMAGSIQFLDIRAPVTGATRSSDTGVYYCLARNSLGQAKSRNASLQVAYIKEEFRLVPKDKLVAIGDDATFDCLPQAWPAPRIHWRHNGQLIDAESAARRLPDGSAKYLIQRIARTQEMSGDPVSAADMVDLIGSQLVIKQVDKGDDGIYSCTVETKGSHRLIERGSPSAKLTALEKPYFIQTPEHQSVQIGGQVKLGCRIGGDPQPKMSWSRQDGKPLTKAKIDHTDKTLILDQVTVADQATYVCEGVNSVGSVRSLATVSVTSRPKFTVHPEDQSVDPGDRIQIRCAGEASPKPMLFWYKEGHRQLMFPPVQQPQQSSPKLLDQWQPQAAPLVASAQDYRPSSGLMSTSDISPSINKIFTMPITSDQIYPTSYNNNHIGNRIYVDNQGTLNIINATISDNGYYACALISSVGSVMAKSKVTVRHLLNANQMGYQDYHDSSNPFEPVHARSSLSNSFYTNSKYDLLPPPVIKLGAANQTLPTNTSATLVCDVVSQVAYKIQWFFNNQPLQDEPNRIMVLESGALSINDLRPSDSGIYTCVVTAASDQVMPLASPYEPLDSSMLTSAPPIQQSTSHSTSLKVASPMNPNIPFHRMDLYAVPSSPGPANLVSTNGNDAITISWAAPSESGALPIREYVVEHYDTSQENLGWKVIYRIKGKESLLIDGLSPEGSHFFVIRAINSHGTGPSSPIAGPMRTVAGEARYQEILKRRQVDTNKPSFDTMNNVRTDVNLARDRLMAIATNLVSLTPMSSTSIRLQWSTQFSSNHSTGSGPESGVNFPLLSAPDVDEFLEGYSIRYRAVGPGESKDFSTGPNWNGMWPIRDDNAPASLPLVTSYIDSNNDESLSRDKRESYFDYSQYEFNEVRVVDHNTEYYTINGLKPYTLYQFFVVPYYKDIDGVPSNILTAQTNEDRPTIAPPNLAARPINNTAVKLLWFHVPQIYANGIIRGYLLKINHSEVLGGGNGTQAEAIRSQIIPEEPRLLNLPTSSLIIAPTPNINQATRSQSPTGQQYIVMYDLTNLTYKSFYKIQVAAMTSAGPGPWSEIYNLIMEPRILADTKFAENDSEDFLSKSLVTNSSDSYGDLNSRSHGMANYYLVSLVLIIVISAVILVGYVLYRRNNQKVITWKKTISEHFTNKFYMPANVDVGPNSIQQNIYDHQQHLIYSGSTHMSQQPVGAQAMWANNNCITPNGSESLKAHGNILPINNDPNLMTRRLNNEQVLHMNNKDLEQRFVNGVPIHQLANQVNVDSSRSINNHPQIIHHGNDYYSVINNMGDYEELDPQQRNNIQLMTNIDRHQTTSSNSDTSCPSSVTRLLPNQNYNRDLMTKNFGDNQRHEIVLQQHVPCSESKQQPFATLISSDPRQQSHMTSLSPYATTNLMNQMPQHLFSNPQMTLIDHQRQQNFIMHNGVGMTMDDSSKAFMQHQQVNGINSPVSVFRTLQRNPMSFQSRAQPQAFMQINNNNSRFVSYNPSDQFHEQAQMITNIVTNPMSDMRSNLYEHIEYSDRQPIQHQLQDKTQQQASQASNDIISSSTSSGSMMSSAQQHTSDQQSSNTKFRRVSGVNPENEAHDLRVFSSPHTTKQSETSNVVARQQQNGNHQLVDGAYEDDEEASEQVDETTAFRQKASQGDNQRVRQLSKRKRQQQRNRLHNNNQKID